MIGVIIPAHNEEPLIASCLRSVLRAAGARSLLGEEVRIIVAIDRCTDATQQVARSMGVATVVLDRGNVGAARAAAADLLLAQGVRWLASTDADSRVPADWLSAQLASGADAFCGTVRVGDWSTYSRAVQKAFAQAHSVEDGHPHIHGANLGVRADWYRRVGGFAPLALHEDRELIQSLQTAGARIARLGRPVVHTSARKACRARGGFGDYLASLELSLAG